MASMLCNTCYIRYPSQVFTICRVCGAALDFSPEVPTAWDAESSRLIRARDHAENAARPAPLLKCGTVRDEDGRDWIYDVDLKRCEYTAPIESLQLFEMLDGSVVEVAGRDAPRQRYWVKVIARADGGF